MLPRLLLALAALAAFPAPAQPLDPARASDLVVEQANAFRREQKLPALETNDSLARAATDFAAFMANSNRFGHKADGNEPAERARRQGYDYCMVAENIGYQYRSRGFRSVAELAGGFVTGWKKSPEHRKNLLDRDAVETGVGMARSASTGRWYAVQLFGRPASKSVKFSVANETSRDVEYRVGEKRHSLPRRSVRTHEVCAAEALKFGRDTYAPKPDDRFSVVDESRGPRLRHLAP